MVAPPAWGRKAQHAVLPLAPQSRDERHWEPMLDWWAALPIWDCPLGSGVRARMGNAKRRRMAVGDCIFVVGVNRLRLVGVWGRESRGGWLWRLEEGLNAIGKILKM